MKTITKIIIFASVVIGVTLVLPLVVIMAAPADFGMGFCMLLFFAANPLLSIGVGILAGTEIKKLWWMPVVSAICFAIFFSFVIFEFVVELYVYSVIYALLGATAMALTALILKSVNKEFVENGR